MKRLYVLILSIPLEAKLVDCERIYWQMALLCPFVFVQSPLEKLVSAVRLFFLSVVVVVDVEHSLLILLRQQLLAKTPCWTCLGWLVVAETELTWVLQAPKPSLAAS